MSEPKVYRTAKPAYLTPQAVADHFGVSTMTVLRLIHEGRLKAVHLRERTFRVRIDELKRFEAANEFPVYADVEEYA